MSVEAMTIVLNHSRAKGSAKIVLMGIANHINPDNDGAWPSQARLARYANITERAVRDAIEILVSLGEIHYEVAAGSSVTQYKTNRYWLTLSCPDDCDRSMGHNRVEVSAVRVEVFDNQGGSFAHSGWKPTSYKTEYKTEEETEVKTYVQTEFEQAFQKFWNTYPRKVRKAKAMAAFRKALKNTNVDTILAGAIRLFNDPNKPDIQYIPHPSTWLNDGGWEDEPYPPKSKPTETNFDALAQWAREQDERMNNESD